MEIVRVMKKTYEIFKSDGQEVSHIAYCLRDEGTYITYILHILVIIAK